MLSWLIDAGVGPATAALPVNWAADVLADKARRWFRRLRRTDGLSRLVSAATGKSISLTDPEFAAVRRLLEDPQTWAMLGHGTVEDLATRIASCLADSGVRAGPDLDVAALAIARGLLEFAVADLEPELFQRLLLARLDRMEKDQASALDQALLGLHADLVSRLAELGAERFTMAIDQLERALDRMSGPADRCEVVVYLNRLTDWLNTDRWPRDRQFGGPLLHPASIERKLRITSQVQGTVRQLDADQEAEQCRRLVILGGPGSGKTWLAKRTVRRCAEKALADLVEGKTLDEIELPLYTTCSQLFNSSGGIREVVVASALNYLPDMGGSRTSSALYNFFTERKAPVLLVIDSLDEAQGSDERLRQADTLPWRIVLTSRPSSWNNQLTIDGKKKSHRVGDLQPLRYPADVESFIHRWFAERPDNGGALAAQIARRLDLQQTATVPLLLAFYCIVGGEAPLPNSRRELYTRVLNRIVTSRWRDSRDRRPDKEACLQTLASWAWSGAAANDPVSGVGTWTDDVITEQARMSQADQDALDNIGTPLGPPDLDNGTTKRRFIHMSIREHLVAEYLATRPAEEAADHLEPHLWFDPDWEEVICAAIGAHPQRNELLGRLIESDSLPPGDALAVRDGLLELRLHLARLAGETRESDWNADWAALIHQARISLSRLDRMPSAREVVDRGRGWGQSDRQLIASMIEQLQSVGDHEIARAIIKLDPLPAEQAQARIALLQHLPHTSDASAAGIAQALDDLSATGEERNLVRNDLLRRQSESRYFHGADIVRALARLSLSPNERAQIRATLARQLSDAAVDKADEIVRTLGEFASSAADRAETLTALLRLPGTRPWWSSAGLIAQTIAALSPTSDQRDQARAALIEWLPYALPWDVPGITRGLTDLISSVDERAQARTALLRQRPDSRHYRVTNIAEVIAVLNPTADEQAQARATLLDQLPDTEPSKALNIVRVIAVLNPTADEQAHARATFLDQLADAEPSRMIDAARVITALDPTVAEQAQVRATLLDQLPGADPSRIIGIAQTMVTFDPDPSEHAQIRAALLDELRHADARTLAGLGQVIVTLDRTADERAQTWTALCNRLSRIDVWPAADLGRVLVSLCENADEQTQIRAALRRHLPSTGEPLTTEIASIFSDWIGSALSIAELVAELGPTQAEQAEIRSALLELLPGGALRPPSETGPGDTIAQALTSFAPDSQTLRRAMQLPIGLTPMRTIAAATRRNISLTEWNALLPQLADISKQWVT
jgi:NACHT domain